MDLTTWRVSGKFLMPLLFVDGHAKMHDFSRTLPLDPGYPYEPTGDWIWYKPADEQAYAAGSHLWIKPPSNIPAQPLPKR